MGEWVELPLVCVVKGGFPAPSNPAGTEMRMTARVYVNPPAPDAPKT